MSPLVDDNKKNVLALGRPEFSAGKKEGEIIAPRHSVPNGSVARSIYEKMRQSHTKRAASFARIQGMIDGNPPYRRSTVVKGGIQTQSNINTRDGEAIQDSVALAYWSLFNDVEFIAEFVTTFADEAQNPELGRIVSEEWDHIMRRWPSFAPLMAQHQEELVTFGVSYLFWPDERDWQFDVADVWSTLVPERSRNQTDQLSMFVVEHVYTAAELWDFVEKGESKGWNTEALADVLLSVAGVQDKDQYSTSFHAEMQRRIRNNDTSLDVMYNDDTLFVSLYIKELSGKVSRGIIHPKYVSKLDEWLFFSEDAYESMGEALQLFTFTPGKRFAHGNKGMGHRTYNMVEVISQIDNSIVDAIRRSATILVRNKQTRGKELNRIQFNYGGFVDIGEAEYVQNLMGSNAGQSIEGARYLRYKLDSNNNISGSAMNTPDGKPLPLGAAQVQATKEARVQKNRISHYQEQLDTLIREIVRKQLKSKTSYPHHDLIDLWKKRCVKRGVPEEFFVLNKENEGQNGLPEHLEVRATRAGGSGSQIADQLETQRMMQILPTAGERGRKAILQDFVAAHRGHRYVKRYFPAEDQTDQPTGEDTIASIENNQLEKGEMCVVSPDNNHAIHGRRHLGRIQQLVKAFSEAEAQARNSGSRTPSIDAENFGQYSLEELDIAIQTLGPHFVRHLFYLQQDPTRAALSKELSAQWAIIANYGDKIANNAQEHRTKKLRDAQEQQQEMTKIEADAQVGMYRADKDAEVKMQKLLADVQRGATRESLEYLLKRMKVSLGAQNDRLKLMHDMSLESAKTANAMIQDQRSAQEETTGKGPGELF